ncbi:MAG: hypothetical protein AMXMBFR61_12200 [Fimbriimonadales bacterium]
MAYERWLQEQLAHIDPQGDRALYYSSSRGYFVAPIPKNGKGAVFGDQAVMVLKLDRNARLAMLMDEVASYAARGRDWLGKEECEPDRWASQYSHFQARIARAIGRAMENHRRQTEMPKEAIASVVAQPKPASAASKSAA